MEGAPQLKVVANTNNESTPATKMLGAAVDIQLYWKFKEIAASRQEDMATAISNAARLYIDLKEAKS